MIAGRACHCESSRVIGIWLLRVLSVDNVVGVAAVPTAIVDTVVCAYLQTSSKRINAGVEIGQKL